MNWRISAVSGISNWLKTQPKVSAVFIKVAIPVHSERWVLLALMETKPSLQVVEACCFSSDEELGAYAKHLTTQAKIPHRWEFRHDHIGYNYRMPNINAALGCAQLENLDRYVADKRETAACYAEFFKGKEDITFLLNLLIANRIIGSMRWY